MWTARDSPFHVVVPGSDLTIHPPSATENSAQPLSGWNNPVNRYAENSAVRAPELRTSDDRTNIDPAKCSTHPAMAGLARSCLSSVSTTDS